MRLTEHPFVASVPDARSVHLRLEDYTMHDVCTVMKRFLRYLDDPVLIHALYPKWLEATGMSPPTVALVLVECWFDLYHIVSNQSDITHFTSVLQFPSRYVNYNAELRYCYGDHIAMLTVSSW